MLGSLRERISMTQNPYDAPRENTSALPGSPPGIEKVAAGQKIIIYGILAYFLAIVLQFTLGPIAGLLGLATIVLGIIGIVRIGSGLGYSTVSKFLLALSFFIPLVGLIVLLMVNARATKALKENGYKVGLLGASK